MPTIQRLIHVRIDTIRNVMNRQGAEHTLLGLTSSSND